MENKESIPKEETALIDLITKAWPIIKDWQQAESKKLEISIEADKIFANYEYRFKKFLIISLGVMLIAILILAFYLFANDKDSIAANLLTISLTGIISFIGGYGLGKSNNNTNYE